MMKSRQNMGTKFTSLNTICKMTTTIIIRLPLKQLLLLLLMMFTVRGSDVSIVIIICFSVHVMTHQPLHLAQ